jgi:hypothetical protein
VLHVRTVYLGRLRVALGWYGMSGLAAARCPLLGVITAFSITDFVLHMHCTLDTLRWSTLLLRIRRQALREVFIN